MRIFIFLSRCFTTRPTSRQGPKYAHATIEKVLKEMFSMSSAPCPLLGDNGYAGNNWIISVAMQRAVKRAIEVEVLSMGPPRDYTSSPAVNQKSVIEREREWSKSSAVKEEKFG
jgi:hypothetical protein